MKKLAVAITGILLIALIAGLQNISENQVHALNDNDEYEDEYEYEYEYYYNDDNVDSDNGSDDTGAVKGAAGDAAAVAEDSDTADATDSDTVDAADGGTDGNVSDATPAENSAEGIDTDPDSIMVFVNKEYPLPKDYVPKNLMMPDIRFYSYDVPDKRYMRKEAAKAVEKMFNAALEDGVTLFGVSGYRSYTRQKEIYDNNVVARGKAITSRISAPPGHSEHQTGLAIDLSSYALRGQLSEEFGQSAEGRWVAENCAKYGFIIRYPKNKENITGYSYEPWHIRYVGKKNAKYIMKNSLTLEEYYGYTPSEDAAGDIISDVQ